MRPFKLPEGRYFQTTTKNVFDSGEYKFKLALPPDKAKGLKAVSSLWVYSRSNRWKFLTSLWIVDNRLTGDIDNRYIYLEQTLNSNSFYYKINYSNFSKGWNKNKQLAFSFS